MTRNPVQARPEQTLRDVAALMQQHDCGCVPVEDPSSHRCVGVVTDRDIVTRAIAAGRGADTRVQDVMSKDPSCCSANDDVERIEQIMSDKQVRRVPVVDNDGRVIGMVAQADLARAADGRGDLTEHEVAQVLERVSEPNWQVRPQQVRH
jgi:CBS domain-containing protein